MDLLATFIDDMKTVGLELVKTFREAGMSVYRGVVGARKEPKSGKQEEQRKDLDEKTSVTYPYYEEMLEVLEDHPDGLKLTEIGDLLGVEWRKLRKTMDQLMEEGKVRKEERTYYRE